MCTYALVEVDYDGDIIRFRCTHEQTAKEMLAELQRVFGWRVRVEALMDYEGDIKGYYVDKCRSYVDYGAWWIFNWLCVHGWEPYASPVRWTKQFRKVLDT